MSEPVYLFRNQKNSIFSFIPLVLFNQFSFFLNLCLLFIASALCTVMEHGWMNLFTCSGTRSIAYSALSLWSSSTSSSSSWISTFLWWPAVSLFHSSGKRFMLRFRLFQKIGTDPMFWCVECLFQLETFSRTWNFHFPLEKNTEPESGPKIQFTISF